MQLNCTTNRNKSSRHCVKHGMSRTRIYKEWESMKNRCHYPSSTSYKYYGGRGISVCEQWRNSFLDFYSWAIENGYNDDLSLDRIDSNKGYSPENCRWITNKEQKRNRPGFVHVITIDGRTQLLSDWIKEFGLCWSTYWKCTSKKGMSELEALNYCISLKARRSEHEKNP